MPNSDQVGYRRPPKGRQFGQPDANPRGPGRGKGSKNVSTIFTEVTGERIAAKTGKGTMRKISKLEAAITQLANKAASGDLRAIAMVLTMAQGLDGQAEKDAPQEVILNDADKRAIRMMAERIKQQFKGDDDDGR